MDKTSKIAARLRIAAALLAGQAFFAQAQAPQLPPPEAVALDEQCRSGACAPPAQARNATHHATDTRKTAGQAG